LNTDAANAYAKSVVTQRVGQQLWQMLWAGLLLAALPAIAHGPSILDAALTLFAIVLAGWFWELPAKAWKVFVTDARHGFNRITPLRFLREQAGRMLLFALIAVPACWLAVFLFQNTGTAWWLMVWLVGWLGFAVLRWVQPRYVAPLFDVVEPLPETALRTRLQSFLKRCGVADQRLFLIRTSTRTAQANAQVTGGLIAPRIVLSDSLIERLAADEVEAVVAHELGHLQRGHLRFQMLMLGGCWLLLLGLIAALTAEIEGSVPRLAVAWALMPGAWFLAQPFANAVYRRFEFEADETAARNSSAAAMAAALRTLTRNNANAVQNDPWYERVYHTHPALAARLARLEEAAS
jgi:STE24 endopeptidase